MATIALDKRYYAIPVQLDNTGLIQISKYQFNRQAIKLFLSSSKGTRKLLPEWGFNFNRDVPYYTDELRAVILNELTTWFPEVVINLLEVFQSDLGVYTVDLQIDYVDTEKITVSFI